MCANVSRSYERTLIKFKQECLCDRKNRLASGKDPYSSTLSRILDHFQDFPPLTDRTLSEIFQCFSGN